MTALGFAFDPASVQPAARNDMLAADLASAGFSIHPCGADKHPLTRWRNESTIRVDCVVSWWRRWPDALPAIDLSKAGLIAIDCDRRVDQDGVENFKSLIARHGLPDGTPIAETAGGGLHFYFVNPAGYGNSKGSLPPAIDVRGDGGYTIAPGAILPDGRAWRTARGAPDLVESFAAGTIPEVPEWLAEIIRAPREEKPSLQSSPRQPSPTSDRREEAYWRAALDDECKNVRNAARGDGNKQLYESALKIGSIVGAGFIGRAEAESALASADITRGGRPKRERDQTIKSGLNNGEKNPREPLSEAELAYFHNPQPRAELREIDTLTSDLLAGFTFDGDGSLKPPPMLVKRLVPLEGICFVGGQSGAGKTFLAIDLAVSLASGEPFFGYKVKERVGVAIFAPEGASTIPLRLHVARNEKAQGELLPIAWLGAVPNLSDRRELPRIIAGLKALDARMRETHGVRLGAVILDTLAASFDLDDEDDNSEAAKTIRVMKTLGSAVGAVMIPVHHYGKGQETGLRGASGWRAGCDSVLSVLADRNQITGKVANRSLALAKSRVGEEGAIAPFELCFVKVDVDEDGDDYGACYVAPLQADAAAIGDPKAKLSRAARAFMSAFQVGVLDKGERAWPFGVEGHEVKAVDRENVRAEFYRSWPADGDTDAKKTAARQKAFKRGEFELIERRMVCVREVAAKTLVWAVREDHSATRTDPDTDSPL